MRDALQPPPAREALEQPGVAVLLRTLDQAFRTKAWHGSSLRVALARLSPEEAAWRPQPEVGNTRHNIWEIAVHCAYWKHVALRRLADPPPTPFPLDGADWFRRPGGDGSKRAWWQDLQLLESVHEELRDAVAGLTDSELARFPRGTATSTEDLIRGVAFHDIYHCGQVQLIKRLYRERHA